MPIEMVLTIISRDRPGVVRELAKIVTDHSGNWIDSSMARLGGEFAGILRVTMPEDCVATFEQDQSHAVGPSELEEQIREAVRGGVSPARKPQVEGGSEVGTGGANELLRQLTGTTFEEIDRLIDELQGLRVHLQSEGQRVQREIVKYAQLSQAAMKSTKVIAEGMTHLQGSAERLH